MRFKKIYFMLMFLSLFLIPIRVGAAQFNETKASEFLGKYYQYNAMVEYINILGDREIKIISSDKPLYTRMFATEDGIYVQSEGNWVLGEYNYKWGDKPFSITSGKVALNDWFTFHYIDKEWSTLCYLDHEISEWVDNVPTDKVVIYPVNYTPPIPSIDTSLIGLSQNGVNITQPLQNYVMDNPYLLGFYYMLDKGNSLGASDINISIKLNNSLDGVVVKQNDAYVGMNGQTKVYWGAVTAELQLLRGSNTVEITVQNISTGEVQVKQKVFNYYPRDIGGGGGQAPDTGGIIPPLPDRTQYDDGIVGSINYVVDVIGYYALLPFRILINLFGSLIDSIQKMIAEFDGFQTFISGVFNMFPTWITLPFASVFSVMILVTIIRFIRG